MKLLKTLSPYVGLITLVLFFVAADKVVCEYLPPAYGQEVQPPQEPTPAPIQNTPAKASIKGPTEVLAGTLLFLSSEDATGNNFKWMIPDHLKDTSASCGTSIFFSIPTPGDYEFGLVAANYSADIDIAYHKVRVRSNLAPIPPPEEPGKPVDPPTQPPVPGNYETLIKVSTDGVAKVNDPKGASQLKDLFLKIVAEAGNKSLDTLRDETAIKTGDLLGSRTRLEWNTHKWGEHWVKPVDTALNELNPKDSRTYLEILTILATTL